MGLSIHTCRKNMKLITKHAWNFFSRHKPINPFICRTGRNTKDTCQTPTCPTDKTLFEFQLDGATKTFWDYVSIVKNLQRKYCYKCSSVQPKHTKIEIPLQMSYGKSIRYYLFQSRFKSYSIQWHNWLA